MPALVTYRLQRDRSALSVQWPAFGRSVGPARFGGAPRFTLDYDGQGRQPAHGKLRAASGAARQNSSSAPTSLRFLSFRKFNSETEEGNCPAGALGLRSCPRSYFAGSQAAGQRIDKGNESPTRGAAGGIRSLSASRFSRL